MLDTTTIKRHHLRYWVDRSQAARRAAEELANKEVRPSLRDLHKNDANEEFVFVLDGHKVEFKDKNEMNMYYLMNTYHLKSDLFTFKEAQEFFGEPDENGWRLPTKAELEDLCYEYPSKYDKGGGTGKVVFDDRLILPAMGIRTCDGIVYCVGSDGYYWSSTPYGSDDAWYFRFDSGEMEVPGFFRCIRLSVRLVRDVK